MADTNQADTAHNSRGSREIRVFLSSTFRDFMEERDLLVKQVFPSLRRRAQERGVEVVDVDLRWGVTQQESEQGKVIGICLAEIERCRPYFIGMLGERYGWTPGQTDYPAELFEREQFGWIRDHQGNASVTELEILHGVLNGKKMEGRAFFYFRDPAWSRAQNEPGFVCDTPEEEQKLSNLKQRIRDSRFPVVENLADPRAIAQQIEADLWSLIEEQFPQLDQPDALERESLKHRAYRQSRQGVYLGGEAYIQQLEEWIKAGESKILITGQSGSGKSALIANWMHRHAQQHPGDVVYAHHLGCSNDANALRPLLSRMLDTASRLLIEHELISEPIRVPEDEWELNAKVAETLLDLDRWCRTTGKRWIWVLDGLDRLDPDDQQELAWLPLVIPKRVSVVISALECQAKTILDARQFRPLSIGPLLRPDQEALIERYLERYTKKLEPERRQQILACQLAKSPLFLRVLLEEIRQCGRYETLKEQIEEYIQPKADGSLAVNDLYERVLERLEQDCGIEVVSKVMTALWVSRAGLSEPELLEITELTPLEWSPIDLALEGSFGRNGNRLLFDHQYLRDAVRDRYLATKEAIEDARDNIITWLQCFPRLEDRVMEEYPWQLQEAGLPSVLEDFLMQINLLADIVSCRGAREICGYWQAVRSYHWSLVEEERRDYSFEEIDMPEIDDLIEPGVEAEISRLESDPSDLLFFTENICDLLDSAGLERDLLLRLRRLSLEARRIVNGSGSFGELVAIKELADLCMHQADYSAAETLLLQCSELHNQAPSPDKLFGACIDEALGQVYRLTDRIHLAREKYQAAIAIKKDLFGNGHPPLLVSLHNYAIFLEQDGRCEESISILKFVLQRKTVVLGESHDSTLDTMGQLARLLASTGCHEEAEDLYKDCIAHQTNKLGENHPDTIFTLENYGALLMRIGKHKDAKVILQRALEHNEKIRGIDHPETLVTLSNLSALYWKMGNLDEALSFLGKCLEGSDSVLGPDHPQTSQTIYQLAELLDDAGRRLEAIPLRRRELEWCRLRNGDTDSGTLTSINGLAIDLRETGELAEAEALFRELLAARQQVLEPGDFGVGQALGGLAKTLEDAGNLEEAVALAQQALDHRLEHEGPDAWWTNRERLDLARVLHKLGRSADALSLLDQLHESMAKLEESDEDDQKLVVDAKELQQSIRSDGQ